MKTLRKWFGGTPLSWTVVVLFAVAAGVITALLKLIPALNDTSFQDIAVTFDCWILFAVFIAVNCRTWWEASLKTFVFFLISQPLVYLIQVPFSADGFGIFRYYTYWFWLTLLTPIGAALACLVKKKNWLSVVILSVATGLLADTAVYHLQNTLVVWPHHLLSVIFCILLAIFLILVLLPKKSHRVVALAVTAAVLIVSLIFTFFTDRAITYGIQLDPATTWTCTVEDEEFATATVTDGYRVSLDCKQEGSTVVCCVSETGETLFYRITRMQNAVTCEEISAP